MSSMLNTNWKEFAEFIASESTHPVSQYIEDGTYICCPFSSFELAEEAFRLSKAGNWKGVAELRDVDYEKENPYNENIAEMLSDEEAINMLNEMAAKLSD